jgi:hypothetical protein
MDVATSVWNGVTAWAPAAMAIRAEPHATFNKLRFMVIPSNFRNEAVAPNLD